MSRASRLKGRRGCLTAVSKLSGHLINGQDQHDERRRTALEGDMLKVTLEPLMNPPPLPAGSTRYYIRKGENEIGPHTVSQLQEQAQNGTLLPVDGVREEHAKDHVPASQIPGLSWPKRRRFSKLQLSFIVAGAVMATMMLTGILGLIILISATVSDKSGHANSALAAGNAVAKAPAVPVEAVLKEYFQKIFNEQKQELFNGLHPIGQAKSVVVHAVVIDQWTQGKATNNLDDVGQATVRYTLYWEGPLEKSGYTKITQTYDTESRRWIKGSILATNGTTKSDLGAAMGFIGGVLLQEALQGN